MTTEVESNPATTLEKIRDGGAQVLVVARNRLREVEDALDRGDFAAAADRCHELQSRVAVLANAEANLASFSGKHIVRAKDLQEGMELSNLGKVANVDVDDHGDHKLVTVDFEGDGAPRQQYQGETELFVLPAHSGD